MTVERSIAPERRRRGRPRGAVGRDVSGVMIGWKEALARRNPSRGRTGMLTGLGTGRMCAEGGRHARWGCGRLAGRAQHTLRGSIDTDEDGFHRSHVRPFRPKARRSRRMARRRWTR
ncbi:putative pollen-specific leucine-rich repeat extensin-like protein 3 [Iris pallida]|uniref:Pollen-specific leucine-rich repeat extensin-like protein 3 n=1 Tax=Iris pallida TaxID=29817 RepID=A0AAX6G9P0_IRIPA|nr:putative pollen-specific leucine-rich repeat extensin-like protein 3 [Iris pallida]